MIEITGRAVSLAVAEDGSALLLGDRRRGCTWRLDPARCGYLAHGEKGTLRPFDSGEATRGGDEIHVRYRAAGGQVVYRYAPADDYVEVSLECDAGSVEVASLPGPMLPDTGTRQVAAPLYQGVLLSGGGPEWELTVGHGGHLNFSMAMAAVMGERGGLMVCHESPTNWNARLAQTADGPLFQFLHERSPVTGWSGATVRLYPTDPDLTAACKCYRARVKERGEFVTWQQKIERKPIVHDLFGALMAFVGYNSCPAIDYVAGAQRLRRMGFNKVFYYPVRMLHYSLDFQMGGDAPIWLSDEQIAAIKSIEGARVAPWAWLVESLDGASDERRAMFKKGSDGRPIPNWQIDRQRWYLVCTPYQVEYVQRRLAGDMRQMDWLHFDVNAVWAGKPCFDTAHAAHRGRAMGRLEDMQWTRRLFSTETVGNRVVSSEGFNDYYAGWYDVGSTKMLPATPWNPNCVPVPMTMLVFHDCCIHDWWELHNYNAHPGAGLCELPQGLGTVGSGRPELKAALDALYGCPPNVFPFGKQYGWADLASRRSFSYVVRLEDPQVQAALRAALPVTRLHGDIGTLEMISFEFLSDDRAVQCSTFSDGTRVVANLAEREADVPGIGPLAPRSWRRL